MQNGRARKYVYVGASLADYGIVGARGFFVPRSRLNRSEPPSFLYCPIQIIDFPREKEEDLVKYLEENNNSLIVSTVDHPEQVLLNHNGVTQRGGLRYTSYAFFQLCNRVSPNLFSLVLDVAGLRNRKSSDPADRYSVEEAIQIFNMCVKRRFRHHIEGTLFLMDVRTGTIEGFFTRAMRRLTNLELYTRTKEALASRKVNAEFFRAQIVGKSMLLLFRDSDPVKIVESIPQSRGREEYYGGVYFCNSELSGSALRFHPALIRGLDGTFSLDKSRNRAVWRCGSRFEKNIEDTFSRAGSKMFDPKFVETRIRKLTAAPLGVTGKNKDEDDRIMRNMAYELYRLRVSLSVARRIVYTAIVSGAFSSEEDNIVDRQNREEWPKRTLYDLYSAATRVAERLPLMMQEHTRRVAFLLFSGLINFS